MVISKELKERAKMTLEDGVFTLKLDEGISLAMLVSFAEDMFPGVSTEDIGVWPSGRRRAGGLGVRRGSSCIELKGPATAFACTAGLSRRSRPNAGHESG
jgi:hypothetical protein